MICVVNYDSMLPLVTGTTKNFMIVPSESNKERKYRVYVDRDGNLRCSCPDNIFRPQKYCKHLTKHVFGGKQ